MVLPITAADAAVVFAGAVVIGQALMVAALLAADARERDAHRWLIVMLLAVAAVSGGDVVEHLHLADRLSWLLPFASGGLLAIGPALWLYVRAVTQPGLASSADASRAGRRVGRRVLLHFAPAVLLVVALLAAGSTSSPAAAEPEVRRSLADFVFLAPVAAQLGAYLLAVARRVFRARGELKQAYSTLQGRTLNWLLLTAALFAAVLLAWVLSWAVDVATSNLMTNLLSALALGVIGVFGARQRNVFERLREPKQMPMFAPEREVAAVAPPKYARSAIGDETAQSLRERLAQLMARDKPFLENDLTLADLARRVDATPHQLSQLFSQHLQETFFDHINRHRVDAVKATLARPQAAGRPLLEIALECGFGSKSAFNDAFRRRTGMNPSEYRRRQPS